MSAGYSAHVGADRPSGGICLFLLSGHSIAGPRYRQLCRRPQPLIHGGPDHLGECEGPISESQERLERFVVDLLHLSSSVVLGTPSRHKGHQLSTRLVTGRKISALRSPTWGATSPRRFHRCAMPSGRVGSREGASAPSEDSHATERPSTNSRWLPERPLTRQSAARHPPTHVRNGGCSGPNWAANALVRGKSTG
jgi:hypothetical protein